MKITGFGLTLNVPDGWTGRVYKRPCEPDETTAPILQAASLPLVVDDDDALTETCKRLGPADAALALYEYEQPRSTEGEATFPAAGEGAISLNGGDLSRRGGVPIEHASFIRTFQKSGRFFALFATFGSSPAPLEHLAQVNDSLASLQVDRLPVQSAATS